MGFKICKYKNNADAIFSFTFDDGCYYDSTLFTLEQFEKIYRETGVKIKATVAQTVSFQSPVLIELWRSATERGYYDVAGHSMTHCISYSEKTPVEEMRADAKDTQESLKGFYPNQKIATFFTPGGGFDKTGAETLKEFYLANRTAGEQVNIPGKIDWYSVSSFTAKMDRNTSDFIEYIDSTIEKGGWGVQMNHWITEKQEDVFHSQRKHTFIEECEYFAKAVAEGKILPQSFEEAVLYLRKAEESSLEIEGNKIKINCKLESPFLDDVALTIAIDSDKPLKITENGITTLCPSKNGIVLADIVKEATIE